MSWSRITDYTIRKSTRQEARRSIKIWTAKTARKSYNETLQGLNECLYRLLRSEMAGEIFGHFKDIRIAFSRACTSKLKEAVRNYRGKRLNACPYSEEQLKERHTERTFLLKIQRGLSDDWVMKGDLRFRIMPKRMRERVYEASARDYDAYLKVCNNPPDAVRPPPRTAKERDRERERETQRTDDLLLLQECNNWLRPVVNIEPLLNILIAVVDLWQPRDKRINKERFKAKIVYPGTVVPDVVEDIEDTFERDDDDEEYKHPRKHSRVHRPEHTFHPIKEPFPIKYPAEHLQTHPKQWLNPPTDRQIIREGIGSPWFPRTKAEPGPLQPLTDFVPSKTDGGPMLDILIPTSTRDFVTRWPRPAWKTFNITTHYVWEEPQTMRCHPDDSPWGDGRCPVYPKDGVLNVLEGLEIDPETGLKMHEDSEFDIDNAHTQSDNLEYVWWARNKFDEDVMENQFAKTWWRRERYKSVKRHPPLDGTVRNSWTENEAEKLPDDLHDVEVLDLDNDHKRSLVDPEPTPTDDDLTPG